MSLFQSKARQGPEVQVTDRRAYRRVQAPIAVRPVGFFGQFLARTVQDVSRGGLRAYSDEAQPVGQRLELELFLPEGSPITVVAQVVWVEKLPEGSPALYDVGMRYVEIRNQDLARIAAFLPKEDEEPPARGS